MNLNFEPYYNFFSFLDTAGFIQGLGLGILLIVLNKEKYKSTFYLGLFLLLSAFHLLPDIIYELGLYNIYPKLQYLPLDFDWLLFSLFFIYTQKVSIFSNRKITYWILYPGIISFLLQIIIYLFADDIKINTDETGWHKIIFFWAAVTYSYIIAVWNIIFLRNHRISVSNYFSLIKKKELYWAQAFLICYLLLDLTYNILAYYIPDDTYSKIFFTLFDLTIIYWLSFHGISQQNVLLLLDKNKIIYLKNNKTLFNQIPSKTEELKDLMALIDNHMASSEIFLHPELTLIDLAGEIKISPRKISTAINSIYKQNFNTYINTFRVKKAKKLLIKNYLDLYSISGIGQEAGFHSKSAFYSAFKKITGTTPNKYKRNTPS